MPLGIDLTLLRRQSFSLLRRLFVRIFRLGGISRIVNLSMPRCSRTCLRLLVSYMGVAMKMRLLSRRARHSSCIFVCLQKSTISRSSAQLFRSLRRHMYGAEPPPGNMDSGFNKRLALSSRLLQLGGLPV